MTDIQQRIERILIEHTYVPGDDLVQGGCTGATCTWHGWFLGDWRRHVADALTAELPLMREERHIPVAESGERWTARSREGAEEAMLAYPAGGSYWTPDGSHDPYDGVTHIESECRYVTEWAARMTTDYHATWSWEPSERDMAIDSMVRAINVVYSRGPRRIAELLVDEGWHKDC